MPTYEYQCKKCGCKFEAFQNITEKPLKICPSCRGEVQRLISAGAGIIFKGKGFYTTDYRNKDYKAREKEDTKTKSPTCSSLRNSETCKRCPMSEDA